ncbi:MAG: PH domain-containing protein [Actinomycetota bacterium]|nr:PH domain-containing protein [Actinomycetota bacterium]
MAFPRRLLSENEELILDLRPHWIALAGPVAVTLIVVVAWVILLGKVDGVPALIVTGAAVLVLLWYPVRAFVAWVTSHFVVTSDRLVHREGLVARSSMEVPLEAINDVRFSQNILERMVGAGDLVIESAGERGQEVFANVRGPESVQKTIYEMRERNVPQGAGSVGASAPSMSVELQRLADLRDRGVLTEQEFQAQKARILRGAGN